MDTLDVIKAAIASSSMSEDDKRFVLASAFTFEGLPEITSQEQYEAYGRAAEEIERLVPHADPHYDPKDWLANMRSQAGMQATAFRARMVEWEEANADD